MEMAGGTQRNGRAQEKAQLCHAIVKSQTGNHVLFIAPITSKEPEKDRRAVAIPETDPIGRTLTVTYPSGSWLTN